MKECRHCGYQYEDHLKECPRCRSSKVIDYQERRRWEQEASGSISYRAKKSYFNSAFVGVLVMVLLINSWIYAFSKNVNGSTGTQVESAASGEEGEKERRAKRNAKTQETVQDAEELYRQGKTEAALARLMDIPDRKRDDEIARMLQEYQRKYISDVIAQAKAQYEEYDAESLFYAEKMLNQALEMIPNNNDLLTALEAYQKSEPVKLSELESFYQIDSGTLGSVECIEEKTDTGGNRHGDVFGAKTFKKTGWPFGEYDEEKYTQYPIAAKTHEPKWAICGQVCHLDFQFKKITGTLFQDEAYRNMPIESGLAIYTWADETWQEGKFTEYAHDWSGVVTGEDEAVDFEVDVLGKQYVSIVMFCDAALANHEGTYPYAFYGDVYLWK